MFEDAFLGLVSALFFLVDVSACNDGESDFFGIFTGLVTTGFVFPDNTDKGSFSTSIF